MREAYTYEELMAVLRLVNPSKLSEVIERGISVEKLNLEANKILNNEKECLEIKHRIADARIFMLLLSGDLPS